MRTLRALVIMPFAVLALSACGSDDATTDATSGADTTAAAVDTTAAGGTDTSVEDTTPVTAIDGPVQIDVVVGVDSGEDRVEHVKVGSDVTLNITNPNAADEFHVHVIELEQSVDAGVTATFNFVADTAGTYEVESHVTEDVLLVIEVG
jgi:ABC-type Fe3+-hydroxamate transport system substrate-binding protein